MPPSELAHNVVSIHDIGGRTLSRLVERLATTPTWPARFDLLDRELLRRAADGPEPDPAIGWAWRQLASTRGQIAIGVLAEEIGWSHRHFVARFGHEVGLGPKAAARVLRFHHASQLLTAGNAPTISVLAAVCGYADHSHLVREFHELAGCTPTALIGARLPDGGGIAG